MKLAMWALTILVLGAAGGCARGPDPFEWSNRKIYDFNMFIDRAVVRDFAMGYEKHVPEGVRNSVDNFFSNLTHLNIILNDHLQGNFAQGWRNTERMAINSTIGVLGLLDVADDMGRPRMRNDFGLTLGRWGFRSGPYLMLPILGPSSVRDLPALVVARVTNPMFWISVPMYVSIPMDVVSFTDQRARLQPQIDLVEQASLDPYSFTRDLYLRYRAATIGEPLPTDDLYGDEGPTTQQAPPSSPPGATDYIR